MEKSCVHIYYGDGKGKTTASLGLCVRCSGRGGKVLFTSFLKSFDSGEFMLDLPFEVVKGCCMDGFWFKCTDDEKAEIREKSMNSLNALFDRIKNEDVDLLVLDEALNAIETGCIDEAVLIELIKNKPCRTEIVLTGRKASEKMIEIADYVTKMTGEKHPYNSGIMARCGIEY